MGAFVRRFSNDPGLDTFTEIEGVDIIDRDAPAPATGLGYGTVVMIGEFEDGEFNTPIEPGSGANLKKQLGGFGYEYSGVVANNPCARARQADGAIVPEYWNGNAAVHLRNKRFRRLICVRVNTSVGNVRFTRLATIKGTARTKWNLEPGQLVTAKVGGGGATTATFTAVAATRTSVAGTFALANGDTVTLCCDDGANFTVTFLTGDTTVANVVARINAAAGFTFASVSGGQVKFDGRKRGTAGQIRVVSSSTAGVLTALGLTVANTAGTGNVADIDAVTFAEIKTVVEAGIAGALVDQLPDGTPRLYSSEGTSIEVTVITATDIGWPVSVVTGASGTAGTIPAGTVVETAGGTQFVVMRSVSVTAGSAGPYEVEVRHALDDGTGLAQAVGAITKVNATTAIELSAFSVTNIASLSAALTEAQIDAAYEAAFDATVNVNTIARDITQVVSARQSNAVRRKGRDNAVVASKSGCRGRSFHARPPMATAVATATGSAGAGVGATRDERVVYNFPGIQVSISEIATRGTAGGTGFNATGLVDVGSDVFAASVRSQLNPEENPAQQTDLMTGAIAVESAYQSTIFGIDEYKAFKAAGIMAPTFQDGEAGFQSGVTSVDPTVYANRVRISRRTMADYIQDSTAAKDKRFSKKLMTKSLRVACIQETEQFLENLLGASTPNSQRIGAYSVTDASTKTERRAGVFRKRLLVTLLPSMDKIVIDSTIGVTVDVNEVDA